MTTTTTTNPTTIAPAATMWTTSRIVALVFSVLEVLLLVRFTFKLFGANAEQGFVSAIYGITEPLVAPFRGIFAQPDGTSGFEIAALLSIVFFMLVAALIVAMVRAYTGRRGEHDAPAAPA
jgi:uncharacterized protein YggT (Ycf19 family)